MQENSVEERCAACGGSVRFFGTRAGWTYVDCAACGSIQLRPLPDPAGMKDAYTADDSMEGVYDVGPDEILRAARRHYEAIAEALEDHGVRDRVVDYGTGWGGLCEVLESRGIRATGLELSKKMAAGARARGVTVREGGLEALDPVENEGIEAITLSAVFEHLIDPVGWLTEARARLTPGGLVVSLQPTAGFARFGAGLFRLGRRSVGLPELVHVFAPPWHVGLYSIRGMREMAKRTGFELVEVRRGPQGRERGLAGLLQAALDHTNRIGWAWAGESWPLVIAHVFVLRKTG